MKVFFILVFILALFVVSEPLLGQSLKVEDVKLLSEGGYKCGYWQLISLRYKVDDGVEGELVLKVGTLKFKAPLHASAHSSGLVNIPFFVPYPEVPIEICFRSETEEIIYSDVGLQLKARLTEAKGIFIGYLDDMTVLPLGDSKALIREELLSDEVYLRQFALVVSSKEKWRQLSSEVKRAFERFVLEGGSAVIFDFRGTRGEPTLETMEEKGRGIIFTIALPTGEDAAESAKKLAEQIASSIRKREMVLRGISPVAPRIYGDRIGLWLILTVTFLVALFYIAVGLRFHPSFLRRVLPVVVPVIFAVLFAAFPSSSVWVVEGELCLRSQEDKVGLLYWFSFVGGYKQFTASVGDFERFALPFDVNTGRVVALSATYQDGTLVELDVGSEPHLFVATRDFSCFIDQKGLPEDRSKALLYVFEGIWAYSYEQDGFGEGKACMSPLKRFARTEAFAEIAEKTSLDIRNIVRNLDYTVRISGEKRSIGGDSNRIITPRVSLIKNR